MQDNWTAGQWRAHILDIMSVMQEYEGGSHLLTTVSRDKFSVGPVPVVHPSNIKKFTSLDDAVDYFMEVEIMPNLGEPDS
tara:strand:- start:5601 stop:5840 length:240 start_codon:yes stop_codon:yes gene_type:complete